MEIACRDCGRVRRRVTLATFVCRYCLSLFGVRVPRKWLGDAPPEDPFVEVSHGPAFGDRAQHNCYWPEELEETMDERAKRGATTTGSAVVKVVLYQEVKPNDDSEVLPLGQYEICEVEWISYRDLGGNHFRGGATFVVASGEHASSKRRIGCIDNGILAKT